MLPLPAAGATGDTAMSSTQHQLIEQCATRLRGIVEALDNIHDTSPHRWSTDLDDVHSSVESLLAMIKDQAPALDAQGLARAALAQPSPAPELERPEVAEVAFVLRNIGAMDAEDIDGDNVDLRFEDAEGRDTGCDVSIVEYAEKAADLFEQHDRIVGALRAENAKLSEALDRWPLIRDSLKLRLADALARVAELEQAMAERNPFGTKLENIAKKLDSTLRGVAQAGQVPQAWLDVQAERRRQVENEGWTPEHDDEHDNGEMARTAACYALAGSSAPNDGTAALLVSLAWPWDEQWWKPSTARRDLIKAGALILAEIERIDRVAASQGGPSDA